MPHFRSIMIDIDATLQIAVVYHKLNQFLNAPVHFIHFSRDDCNSWICWSTKGRSLSRTTWSTSCRNIPATQAEPGQVWNGKCEERFNHNNGRILKGLWLV